MAQSNAQRLRSFIAQFTSLIERRPDENRVFDEGGALLGELITHDDWLPAESAVAVADGYRQYLLHCDPLERFSVVSFVWGPGVKTPIHDHTVWGMVGVMRGAELCHEFAPPVQGARQGVGTTGAGGAPIKATGTHLCKPGDIDLVSPTVGDIHVVENALPDQPSVSIHVYGANIGAVRRHVFGESGEVKAFVSGYSNAALPNIWDRSKEA